MLRCCCGKHYSTPAEGCAGILTSQLCASCHYQWFKEHLQICSWICNNGFRFQGKNNLNSWYFQDSSGTRLRPLKGCSTLIEKGICLVFECAVYGVIINRSKIGSFLNIYFYISFFVGDDKWSSTNLYSPIWRFFLHIGCQVFDKKLNIE